MKKILTLVSLSVFFISCENTDNTSDLSNESAPEAHYLLRELLGKEEYVDYDSSIDIMNNVTISTYEPEMHDGYLDIRGMFPKEEEVGAVLLNEKIMLDKENEYDKSYRYEEANQMVIDKNELFDNTIKIRSLDTSRKSSYYNLNLDIPSFSTIKDFRFEGLKDIVNFYSYNDMTFRWSVTGNPNEDMLLVIYSTKDVGNGNRPQQILKKFKNSAGMLVVKGSELNHIFTDDSDLSFTFVKGQQIANVISPSDKVFSVNRMQFINLAGVRYKH